MAVDSIESRVQNLLSSIIENLGYELYDVIYEKEGKEYYLRVVIDKEDGIDLNDCEKVNNAITDILDEADYIKEQYFLEVSSPGVERLLRKGEHYEKQIGNKICVKLFKAIDKQKEIIGILEKYNKDEIVLRKDEKIFNIDVKNIAIAKTVFDW